MRDVLERFDLEDRMIDDVLDLQLPGEAGRDETLRPLVRRDNCGSSRGPPLPATQTRSPSPDLSGDVDARFVSHPRENGIPAGAMTWAGGGLLREVFRVVDYNLLVWF